MRLKKIMAGVLASAMTLTAGILSNITPAMQTEMTASAEEDLKCGDYLSYKKVDKDEDGTYDYIRITSCDESAVSVEIPSEIEGLPVTEIGDYAFYGCYGLTSVDIPDSVTEIGRSAFSGCTSLTSVEIPDSVTEIGYMAFADCTGLTSIEVPDSVTAIDSYAFYGTPVLENQTDVKYAGKWVIGCDNDVTEAEIKSGTKGISAGAFSYCSSLPSIEIPDSVTYIGGWAFCNCTNLASITIKNPECEIDNNAYTICNRYENEKAYFNGTIYGYENSTAQAYAEKYDYKFESLGESSVTTAPPTTTVSTTTTTIITTPEITTATTSTESTTTAPETTTTTTTTEVTKTTATTTTTAEQTTATTETETTEPVTTTTAQTTTAPVTTKPFLRGDISGNGKIDLQDIIQIAKFIIKTRTFTDEEMLIADYNNDGKVGLQDIIGIAKYILKANK